MTLKIGVVLHISLQLANHKSQRSDFGAVFKANNGNWRFHYRWLIFFYEKEGTTNLERVAFHSRLSILCKRLTTNVIHASGHFCVNFIDKNILTSLQELFYVLLYVTLCPF